MSSHEIVAAALRWHTLHIKRMAVGAAKRRHGASYKKDGDVLGQHYRLAAEAAQELTQAKRLELAALRKLAKACAKLRSEQGQSDTLGDAMDVEAQQVESCTP